MKDYIAKLKGKGNLSIQEIQDVMQCVMKGEASHEDLASFLLALRDKGPTIEEITGAAQIMRKFFVPVKTHHRVVLDTCGTGGDKTGTFNISTIAAFVVAGCGIVVAKHGNRSVSSQCGSADVLEALGLNLNLDSSRLSECLDKVGIAFLFAQKLHPAMKHAAPVRKALGVETIFNILGPLANPALATHQVMGVYRRELVEPLAHVLKNLGLRRALVVHGSDGLDEVTITGETFACEYDGTRVFSYRISPEELNIKKADPQDLKGGNLNTNTQIAKDILAGKRGPKRDIVVLNAACGLYISQAVRSIEDGLTVAASSIDSGRAREKLEQLGEFTNSGR